MGSEIGRGTISIMQRHHAGLVALAAADPDPFRRQRKLAVLAAWQLAMAGAFLEGARVAANAAVRCVEAGDVKGADVCADVLKVAVRRIDAGAGLTLLRRGEIDSRRLTDTQ